MQLTQPTTTCRFLGYGQAPIPNQHGRAGKAIYNARSLPGLFGWAPVVERVSMSKMRSNKRVADEERADSMLRMPPSAIGYDGHGAGKLTYAAADLVSGDVVRLREQERDECPKPSALTGVAELQYGMALPAQAAKGHGETRTGVFVGDRRGGRSILGWASRGEKRTWSVWQTDCFCRGGSARTKGRQNQVIAYSRCVGGHIRTSRCRICYQGLDCSDGRMEGIQQRYDCWLYTRGGGGEHGRIGEYCASQVPSCGQPCETLDTGNATRQCREGTLAGLFERIHIQVQPERLKEPWSSVLQIGATGSCYAPKSSIQNCASTRCCGRLSQLHTQSIK